VENCRRQLAATGDAADPAAEAILDEVLAYTNSLAAVIDPFDITAPPVAPVPAPAPTPASAPVQPDFFGGAGKAPPKRRATARRR
jgi:exodeoxyribonuclease-1